MLLNPWIDQMGVIDSHLPKLLPPDYNTTSLHSSMMP